jgi:hypothetical protein
MFRIPKPKKLLIVSWDDMKVGLNSKKTFSKGCKSEAGSLGLDGRKVRIPGDTKAPEDILRCLDISKMEKPYA